MHIDLKYLDVVQHDMNSSSASTNSTPSLPVFSSFFANLPTVDAGAEILDVIAEHPNIVIERIVSGTSHASEQWYDQPETEFCAVLQGAAQLVFELDPTPVRMDVGDWVIIPPHARHKVASTHDSQTTVWIAVKFKAAPL